MNDQISERIRIIIEHYGLSVSAFADKIGVQRSSISHLLNGRNRPSLDFVLKIIQTYPEVNLYWLLNGKGEFPSKENPSPTPIAVHDEEQAIYKTKKIQALKSTGAEPVRIVIFYSDGSFESFNTKK